MSHFLEEGVEITAARVLPAGVIPPQALPGNKGHAQPSFPALCQVEGIINRRSGAEGVEYGIRFAIGLPMDWNGRLLFQGGGGYNGSFRPPVGWAGSAGGTATARGFAVIVSDSGHRGAEFDRSFQRDQQSAIDYAYLAVPTVTLLGKELTAAFYGRAPHHSYSLGCSTGGREGMMAAQRYPALFDGVVAGSPAMRTEHTRLGVWNAMVAFNRISPRDLDGKPLPLQAFPEADQRLLHTAVAKQCDALDGLTDGLVLNLPACRFDPAILQCGGRKDQSCLSVAQVDALKTAFRGPVNSRGLPAYAGYPWDLGLLGEYVGNPIGVLPGKVLPEPYTETLPDPFALDIDGLVDAIYLNGRQTLQDTATLTDLGSFYRRGGKIMFYHGASDPWFSLFDTLSYFENNKAANPEFDSSRLYSVPGFGHCTGGGLNRFDMLDDLVSWVEEDRAPTAVMAGDWEDQIGSRPLCPWPQYGRYRGTGDRQSASSFECVLS